ncbi:MAG TPA: hypothetical protein VGA37_08290 [Gemmatimonadales bacterium]
MMRRASVRRARGRITTARIGEDVTLLNRDGTPIGTVSTTSGRPSFGAHAPALLLRRDL